MVSNIALSVHAAEPAALASVGIPECAGLAVPGETGTSIAARATVKNGAKVAIISDIGIERAYRTALVASRQPK